MFAEICDRNRNRTAHRNSKQIHSQKRVYARELTTSSPNNIFWWFRNDFQFLPACDVRVSLRLSSNSWIVQCSWPTAAGLFLSIFIFFFWKSHSKSRLRIWISFSLVIKTSSNEMYLFSAHRFVWALHAQHAFNFDFSINSLHWMAVAPTENGCVSTPRLSLRFCILAVSCVFIDTLCCQSTFT